MKIIALTPVKNEEWILPTYLSGINKIADEIIVVDDGSTDKSKEILRNAGVFVYDNTEKVKSGWPEHSIREKLLELGRKHGGTHFICLDADEVFSKTFQVKAREYISKLLPGQKLSMKWNLIWGDIKKERIDGVWKNLYKDFVFCDNGNMKYPYSFLHVSRTPNPIEKIEPLIINDGCVLHFQNFYLEKGQIKQAEVRCSELIQGDKSARRINLLYSITLNNTVETKEIPEIEFDGLILPQKNFNINDTWHYQQIIKWFEKYGVDFFEPLEIWHIPELKKIFLEKNSREPKTQIYPKILIRLNYIKNYIKNNILEQINKII